MPYIKLGDRKKFQPMVTTMLNLLNGGESAWIKGEMFGYFVNRISFGFLDQVANTAFNSNSFTPANRKTINDAADKISVELKGGGDPMRTAGDLNYVVSAVLWGFLGKASTSKDADYSMSAYMTGVIEHVQCQVKNAYISGGGSVAGSAVMAFRRHLLVCGVLRDVLMESYHVNMRVYEDLKRRENGDLWSQQGALNIGEVETRQPHEIARRP